MPAVKVRVPSSLYSYTGGVALLDAEGTTLGAVLDHLEARFPGLRFRIVDEQDRIRTHIRIHVGAPQVADLSAPVRTGEEVFIMTALSGG
jgi:molybdopterin converting factor small subunit